MRQYDAAVERVLEATLGRISKLFDNSVTGESVSRCLSQGSSADSNTLDVPQEVIGEKELVRADVVKADSSQASTTVVRHFVFLASLLFLFMSGALGRYAQIGRELALGW